MYQSRGDLWRIAQRRGEHGRSIVAKAAADFRGRRVVNSLGAIWGLLGKKGIAMIIELCSAVPRVETDCVRGERIVTRRHGYLPSWRCQVGKVMPPQMATSAVHLVVDVTSWLAALIVVPAMIDPYLNRGDWTPESVFLLVALSVQLVASESRVTKVVEPDFFGMGRWLVASIAAAAVVFVAFQGQQVSWDLLAAGSLLALVIRAAAEDVIFALRRHLYHRASTLVPVKIVPVRAPAAIPVRPARAPLAAMLGLRPLAAAGRIGLPLAGMPRH